MAIKSNVDVAQSLAANEAIRSDVQVEGIEVTEISFAEANRLLARNNVPHVKGEKVVPLHGAPSDSLALVPMGDAS